jgi:hypothetical protein
VVLVEFFHYLLCLHVNPLAESVYNSPPLIVCQDILARYGEPEPTCHKLGINRLQKNEVIFKNPFVAQKIFRGGHPAP